MVQSKTIIFLFFCLLLLVGCSKQPKIIYVVNNDTNYISTDIIFIPAERTQTTNCTFDNWPLQDYDCTPGAVLNVTAKDICYSGYSASVRDVSESLKDEVYNKYNIYDRQPYEYEIDHTVPLSIGGSNLINNLWPEKYNDTYGARIKDKVENCFHKRVCDGSMDLAKAQYLMAKNWTIGLELCNISIGGN